MKYVLAGSGGGGLLLAISDGYWFMLQRSLANAVRVSLHSPYAMGWREWTRIFPLCCFPQVASRGGENDEVTVRLSLVEKSSSRR